MWEDPEVDGKMRFKSSECRNGLLEFERKRNEETLKSVGRPVRLRREVSSYNKTIKTLY
jgi:hypothetical protein